MLIIKIGIFLKVIDQGFDIKTVTNPMWLFITMDMFDWTHVAPHSLSVLFNIDSFSIAVK